MLQLFANTPKFALEVFCEKKIQNLILTIKDIYFCKFDIKNGFLDPQTPPDQIFGRLALLRQ